VYEQSMVRQAYQVRRAALLRCKGLISPAPPMYLTALATAYTDAYTPFSVPYVPDVDLPRTSRP
jgi:hypothetical protein